MPAFTWKKIITNADDADYKNSSIDAGDLPVASSSAVGGVKIGTGVTIGMDGAISVASGSDTTNSSLAFSSGTLSLTDSASNAVSVSLDGRYALSSVSGVTNLGNTKSSTTNVITSDTGTNATIALADGTNAGLLSPTKNTQISNNKANITTLTTAVGLNTAKNTNVTTNLDYTPSSTTGSVTSSDGTNATIPVRQEGGMAGTNSGLMTSSDYSAIVANSAKTGITSSQASAITANTAKTGISSAQASAITANTAKTGITSAQASAITANTAKTGITSAQASAISANTAKTGISSAQASAISANTSKVSCTETAVKNVLSALNSGDTLNIGDSGNDTTININGNLQVSGTTTTINTTNLAVADSLVELNSDYTGSTPSGTQGIKVNRGSATGGDASLVWNETSDRWQLDFDSEKHPVAFVDINTGTTPGSGVESWGIGSMAIDNSGDFYIRTA